MSKLSAKHQVTIPIDIVKEMELQPGDELAWACYQGQITAFKKTMGAASGLLSNVIANDDTSDEESLQSIINDRH